MAAFGPSKSIKTADIGRSEPILDRARLAVQWATLPRHVPIPEVAQQKTDGMLVAQVLPSGRD